MAKSKIQAPTTVDDYLAAVPEPSRAALEQLRQTIRSAAPNAIETISYQMPTFKLNGRFLVSYAAFAEHCSLFPASVKALAAYGEELKPFFSGKGTLRFTAEAPIPSELVTKVVNMAIAENAVSSRG